MGNNKSRVFKLIEAINKVLFSQKINEMSFVTDPDYTKELGNKPIGTILLEIKKRRKGFVKTKFPISLCQVGKTLSKSYSFCINWGEPDIKGASGHGILHILQGHKQVDFNKVVQTLPRVIASGTVANEDSDNIGNYIIIRDKIKFVFSIDDKCPTNVLLVSAYDLRKKSSKKTK